MGTLLCSLETCSLSQVVVFRSRVTSTFRNVFSALSHRDGEILQQVENNTAFTSDATWPPTVCHSGAGVAQRSLPSRTQLSEGSLLK